MNEYGLRWTEAARRGGRLPGKVTAITDRYAGVLTYRDGEIQHEAFSIGR